MTMSAVMPIFFRSLIFFVYRRTRCDSEKHPKTKAIPGLWYSSILWSFLSVPNVERKIEQYLSKIPEKKRRRNESEFWSWTTIGNLKIISVLIKASIHHISRDLNMYNIPNLSPIHHNWINWIDEESIGDGDVWYVSFR